MDKASTSKQRNILVFIGSYAEPSEQGVQSFSFNQETGELTLLSGVAGLKNPTFVNVDPFHRIVYSINERTNAQGGKAGEIVAYQYDDVTGHFNFLNRANSTDGPNCHIQRDPYDEFLLTVSYHSGQVGLNSIDAATGSVGPLEDQAQHVGKSVHPNQDKPHPHSIFYSPDGRFAHVQDLGTDSIITYTVDAQTKVLHRSGVTTLHPGGGPRHLVFHPVLPCAYVIHELDSTITHLHYDAYNGTFTEQEVVSTLPTDYDSTNNATAEIAISEDGLTLYGSNRGHDSIVIFKINPKDGSLRLQGHVASGGGHPRHFALVPGGRWLLCANRDSNNIVSLRIDSQSGTLTNVGIEMKMSKPVCVVPVEV